MADSLIWNQIVQIPPITRYLVLMTVTTTFLIYINAVSPYTLFYSPLYMKKLELWRIVTCFLYLGKPTLDVVMHIIFLYRYSKMLEEGCMNTSEYFWLMSVISVALFVISNIYGVPSLGASLSATITYIWTKRNPRAIVQILGFISFPAFYLPFILPGFMLLSKRSILIEDLLGIIVGHSFYYFKDVYPRWGSDILKTPCWVKRLFSEHPPKCSVCEESKMSKGHKVKDLKRMIKDKEGDIVHTEGAIGGLNEQLEEAIEQQEEVIKQPEEIIKQPEDLIEQPEEIIKQPEEIIEDNNKKGNNEENTWDEDWGLDSSEN